MKTDILIIGGGPAGLTAAVYALRAGKSVLVIEKNGFGGQIAFSPKVENIPGTISISGAAFAEQLIENFDAAINGQQFTVFYQPKFDVQCDPPRLASAEALVRWQHPTLGMISPGVFIPLFENNGLIQRLDLYVWCKAAAQIKDWRERLGYSVPVSVNVSRIDMYDPDLIGKFQQILEDYDSQRTSSCSR